ncbi:hypothetical protein [Hymenobacter antarcticus]|uniref:Trypsin-like peptidase domain-containing protein n=1 Tax=Hymenobacter antarcticus TaxID=486270 RepID=A0ABP7QFR3_9BACT
MEAVVQIYYRENDSDYCFIGSGFFISHKIIVTVGHNFDVPGKYFALLNGEFLELRILKKEKEFKGNTKIDLALCAFVDRDIVNEIYFEPVSEAPKRFEECKVIGFSVHGEVEKDVCYKPRDITQFIEHCEMHFEGANSGEYNIEFLALSLQNIKKGMSGGVIINAEGQYIGALIGPRLFNTPTGAIGNSNYFVIMSSSFKRILQFQKDSSS